MSARGAAAPVTAAEFAAALQALGVDFRDGIALGVSGGADSMALLRLCAAFATRRRLRLVAFTVDHALRAASAGEARRVAGWCRALGVEHRTLRWRGPKPATGVQAAARAARYHLLGAACRRLKLRTLAVAHNLEDQAETVLLRLGRGSGLDGLSGMAAVRPLDAEGGVVLCRPLLGFPRARLGATLRALKQDWIEDPSNRDERYQRVRVREALRLLAPDDVVPERIAGAARHVARARAALDRAARDLLARAATYGPAGSYALVDVPALSGAGEEIARRALRELLTSTAGKALPPDGAAVDRLWRELAAGRVPRETLHGCRLMPWRGRLLVCREARHLPAPRQIAPGRAWQAWDGERVLLRLGSGSPATLGPLGAEGWRQLVAVRPGIAAETPRVAAVTAPSLWRNGRLLAAPWFDFRALGIGVLSARLAKYPAGNAPKP